MRNILLIIKHEILTTIRKPSFWVMTVLFPVFIIGLNIGTQITTQRTIEESSEASQARQAQGRPLGYVDEAGLIQSLPDDIPAEALQPYLSQTAAQDALAQGNIESYAVIPQDYLESGELIIVQADYSPLGATPEGLFEYVIAHNLASDPALLEALNNPLEEVHSTRLAPAEAEAEQDSSNPLASLVPYAVLFIFFFLITLGSGYMLQSVSREKENRMVEMLLVSLNPRQLMLGKILGLSLVALLQMALWMGGGLVALGNLGRILESAATFDLPAGFLLWSVLYFFLGYLMYASLMGAIGALAPSAQEAGQVTFFVLLPLMIPLWFNQAVLQDPNGTTAQALSLIPFTAPIVMLTRLAAGEVPLWQVLAGLAGLAVTTYFIVLLAARFFRADTLLSTAPLKKERFFNTLRG